MATSRFARIMQKHKARVQERVLRMEIASLLMALANEQSKIADELDEYPVKRKVHKTKETNQCLA